MKCKEKLSKLSNIVTLHFINTRSWLQKWSREKSKGVSSKLVHIHWRYLSNLCFWPLISKAMQQIKALYARLYSHIGTLPKWCSESPIQICYTGIVGYDWFDGKLFDFAFTMGVLICKRGWWFVCRTTADISLCQGKKEEIAFKEYMDLERGGDVGGGAFFRKFV